MLQRFARQAALILILVLALAPVLAVDAAAEPLAPRPPAVPLATHTPYFSVWSPTDRLADAPTVHWTGQPQPLAGLIRIDGRAYRVMGTDPAGVPALAQRSLRITPTRSIYRFGNDQIELTLTFASPVIAADLELTGRPVSYVVWEVRSADGRPHRVEVLLGAAADLAAGSPTDAMAWSREAIPGVPGVPGASEVPGVTALKMGVEAQPVLGRAGDRVRIDWGHAYLAAPSAGSSGVVGAWESLLRSFAEGGELLEAMDADMPRAANDRTPAMAIAIDLGAVEAARRVYHMLAYDERKAMRYFGQPLDPWWRRNGATPGELLRTAAAEFESVLQRAEAFDERVLADATRIGGEKYAYLCALAYRQAMASNTLAADANGMPLLFNKEISSFGLAQTVDVIYPMSPQVLLFSPALAKAMLVPVLQYCDSDLWPFPYACHDIGMYPRPQGNVYGGMDPGNDPGRMPVEESGNMLLMIAAVAHRQGGDVGFARPYWRTLEQWADYLAEHGIDPVNQLCTDDFAGHLARNANLSVKAILGIGAMARLCEYAGDEAGRKKYRRLAENGVRRWLQLADAGDHSVLAFGNPDTWSLKYNLVWDRILGLDLFPQSVARQEADFYLTKMNRYGVPLDSRQEATGMTKADWLVWSATLGSRRHFDAMIGPLYDFYSQVPQRHPMTDWYRTIDGQEIGFVARPVVGGVFLPFLYHEDLWDGWARAAQPLPDGDWAPLPRPPKIAAVVVPAADRQPATWRYTTSRPAADWMMPAFDDGAWERGRSGFGTPGTPGATINTTWNTSDIWLRRTFTIPADAPEPLWLYVHHDEDATIYLNGRLVGTLGGYVTAYEPTPIPGEQAAAELRPGNRVTIAIHCRQTSGGQYIDAGVVAVKQPERRAARD